MWANAYAPVTTVRPKARATPRMPTLPSASDRPRTAVPTPPSTSQNVPRNSAASCLDRGMEGPPKEDGRRRDLSTRPLDVPLLSRAPGGDVVGRAPPRHGGEL